MKVVRQWMIRPLEATAVLLGRSSVIVALLATLAACNPTELPPGTARSNVITNDGSYDNKAFVYLDSPYILGGPNYGPGNVNMTTFTDRQARPVTPNMNLTGNCEMYFFSTPVKLDECVRTLSRASGSTQPLPRKSDRTYIFPTNSPEFYQVNALYHINAGNAVFFKKLANAYALSQQLLGAGVPKAIPYYLMNSKLFWFKALSSTDRRIFNFDYLTTYAQCDEENAYFAPAGPTICLGRLEEFPGFYFVQDPSVIYHELGHAYVSVLMNLRNGTSGVSYHPFRSNLGSFGYDEAGAINEGIADYYSYLMNKRERFGEFALGRTLRQARPLTEADDLHPIPTLAETPEGRLSYPQYLLYDPNDPDENPEDVHYAGQIVSHYLVALTKNLRRDCGYTRDPDGGHDRATDVVVLLLAETLAELGDLNARGIDNSTAPLTGANFFVNLDATSSYLWTQYNNPVNYRRFFQTLAKNINKFVSYSDPFAFRSGLCPAFTKNKSEKLLDDYGLLLFRTYNDDGTSTKSRAVTYTSEVPTLAPSPLTVVSENNRRKSVLVSKQLVDLAARDDENPSRFSLYLIDTSSAIEGFLRQLLFKGFTVPVSTNVAGTIYNNNNLKLSPGEVVGVIPNLVNNSNSTMAGVQLLATDWDHVHVTDRTTGNFKPCVTNGANVYDAATTVDQGGEQGLTCAEPTQTSFRRLVPGADKLFPAAAAAPVCLVLLEDGDSSRWVSQNEFRVKQGLNLLPKDCLGYTTGTTTDEDFTFNPHECLVRFLPGANESFYSKIDAQKTYYETVMKDSSKTFFNTGTVLLMEINKWIPPGTKFRCRLRARFSNCSDCYTDGSNANDFIDAEYNGPKPFKVINFDFEVND